MTEEEAKKRWCPMYRICMAEGYQSMDNRGYTDVAIAPRCIASDCMMWRRIITCDDKDTKGYCGLGGTP